jgi:hypothetical protein
MQPPTRQFGWVRPEARGRAPHAGRRTALSLDGIAPSGLFSDLPPVYDQHRVGSCTAQALAGAVEILAPRSGYARERPRRKALYRRERELIGTTGEDSGAILADGIAVLRCGWEAETEEPPPVWGPEWLEPAPVLRLDAPRVVSSEPLDLDPATLAWELSCGHPVAVGLQVTEAWMGLAGASLPPPREAGDVVGGHAVLLVGYDLPARVWRVRNSWGEEWGEGGYAWLPWEWTSLPWCGEAHALRAIRRMERPAARPSTA